jgi:hypothetical protein
MVMHDMIREAADRHGEIRPCDGLDWPGCCTEDFGHMHLWYNDEYGSTHIVKRPIPN